MEMKETTRESLNRAVFTRRRLLRLAGVGLLSGAALELVAACAPTPAAPTAAPKPTEAPKPAAPAPAASPAAAAKPAASPAAAPAAAAASPAAAAKPAAPAASPAAAAPAVKGAPEKVSFLASWKIDGARAPWMLAQERGYFRDQGIDFEIVEGQGSSQVARVVGAGTNTMGEIDGGVLIQSVAQNVPIKGVAAVLPLGTIAVMVPRASNIKAPKELEGKKLAGVAGSAAEVIFPGWMKANGGDPDKVEMVMLAVAAKATSSCRGRSTGCPATRPATC
jgi:ABC-type nitrate/sulfonate/bicarbonate transport system substrate-binding protein